MGASARKLRPVVLTRTTRGDVDLKQWARGIAASASPMSDDRFAQVSAPFLSAARAQRQNVTKAA
ncbi:hypothetical protein [Microbacterium sp.]|uniref:hypothetical protein n=1 Tax=Microbacterium sp. TaxID=51671 RepID=UPI0033403A04